MIGHLLQHYRILEKIGEGGMGEVYAAEDQKLDRRVALKILPADLAQEPDRLRRFEREAKAIASLNHPNIVTIYAVEHIDGIHFLAMELIEGSPLDEHIPGIGLVLEDFFQYAIPIVEALAAAHEQGITHRDIKPSNVMLADNGRIKVLDFGLAKLESSFGNNIEQSTQTLTEEGSIIGTVPYMAPEQFTGKSLDARTDIFSLGVLFHQMLTGTRPFRGESSAELISSILRDKPAPVSEIKTDLPNHLGRIVRRCLEKDPERRYQTAIDLRNELEGLREELDSGVMQLPASALPPPPPPPPKEQSRPPWLIPAAVVGALAVLLLAFFGLRGGSEPEPEPPPPEPTATTIAVLPLEELGEPASTDFARMLTSEVSNRLTQLPGVRIVSQSTVSQSADDGLIAKQIGELVGADYVLEGSLFWSQIEEEASVLRFTERLIRVEDDIQVLFHDRLSEFDRPLSLQSDLAVDVAELLGGELLDLPPREMAVLFPPPPPDLGEEPEEDEPEPVQQPTRRRQPRTQTPAPAPAQPTDIAQTPTVETSEPAVETPAEAETPVTDPEPALVPVTVSLDTPLDDGILTIYAEQSTVFRRPFKPRRRAEAETMPTRFEIAPQATQLRIYAAPAGKPAKLQRLDADFTGRDGAALKVRVTRRGEVRATLE